MEDDSPVFSMLILANEAWDLHLTSNDFIRIQAIPDRKATKPDNPYIMVGLISDIQKEGDYDDGTLLYRITGRAMSKALIDFEVGLIEEVSVIPNSIGWLPDGTDEGLDFSGSSAQLIGQQLMERFVYEYMEYDIKGGKRGKNLKDFFTYSFDSWKEYETLGDPSIFTNYEGNLKQFLDDIAAKPFNELFFEYMRDGRCLAVMRRTPFDPKFWQDLPTLKITSDVVLEESFGKSDTEMHSVYVVHAPNLQEFDNMDLGVFPKYHPNLISKYGYKRLDADNIYLLSEGVSEVADEVSEDTEDADEDEATVYDRPEFNEVAQFINTALEEEPDVIREDRNKMEVALEDEYPMFTSKEASKIVDAVADDDFTKERYETDVSMTGDEDLDAKINKEKNESNEKLELFTKKLYNWYCENANFYSGDIRIIGDPDYRIGYRLEYDDKERSEKWEFYIESIQHEFSLDNGFTTILGVTRGLPNKGKKRFTNLYGKSQEFKGGYFGELSIEEVVASADTGDEDGDGGSGAAGGAAGGDVAMKALETGLDSKSKASTYDWGGGRTQDNPLHKSHIYVDCSSFVFWCYYEHGVTLNGGKTGMNTDSIKVDSQFSTVSNKGSSKKAAMEKLKKGDVVWFDTYKGDGHVGLYEGGGKFVGAQSSTGIASVDMTTGYWKEKFNGRVLRYK